MHACMADMPVYTCTHSCSLSHTHTYTHTHTEQRVIFQCPLFILLQPSIATATNIDTLLAGQGKEEISVPPESLQDKVFFIFNNLSLANMAQKVIPVSYLGFFSHYEPSDTYLCLPGKRCWAQSQTAEKFVWGKKIPQRRCR